MTGAEEEERCDRESNPGLRDESAESETLDHQVLAKI